LRFRIDRNSRTDATRHLSPAPMLMSSRVISSGECFCICRQTSTTLNVDSCTKRIQLPLLQMSTCFFVTRILNSNHNFSEGVGCGGAACEALGNTVSPSLPFNMSQFLHGRAEGGARIEGSGIQPTGEGFDMRGCAAHTRHDLQGGSRVKERALSRGSHLADQRFLPEQRAHRNRKWSTSAVAHVSRSRTRHIWLNARTLATGDIWDRGASGVESAFFAASCASNAASPQESVKWSMMREAMLCEPAWGTSTVRKHAALPRRRHACIHIHMCINITAITSRACLRLRSHAARSFPRPPRRQSAQGECARESREQTSAV
jgi:hypothetical protein